MSDREARALGAGVFVTVKGKEYELSPISIRDLSVLQKECLQSYKNGFIDTYAQNCSVFGDRGLSILEKKVDEAAKWDTRDLPKKMAYSTDDIPLNDEIKARLKEIYGYEPANDDSWRALISTALDQEHITSDEVESITGKRPDQGLISYDQWWVTASTEGWISFVFMSIRQKDPTVTREEICQWPPHELIMAARRVENLTTPAVGNTSSPSPEE